MALLVRFSQKCALIAEINSFIEIEDRATSIFDKFRSTLVGTRPARKRWMKILPKKAFLARPNKLKMLQSKKHFFWKRGQPSIVIGGAQEKGHFHRKNFLTELGFRKRCDVILK